MVSVGLAACFRFFDFGVWCYAWCVRDLFGVGILIRFWVCLCFVGFRCFDCLAGLF